MTFIVTLEIAPGGDESKKKTIGTIRAVNESPDPITGSYRITVEGLGAKKPLLLRVRRHQRKRGAWILLKHILSLLEDSVLEQL